MVRAAVEADRFALLVDIETELRADENPVMHGRHGFSYQLLVGERTIGLRRVEERDASVEGRPDHLDRLLLFCGRAKAEAWAHAAKTDGRDREATSSEFAFLHNRVCCQCSERADARSCAVLSVVSRTL